MAGYKEQEKLVVRLTFSLIPYVSLMNPGGVEMLCSTVRFYFQNSHKHPHDLYRRHLRPITRNISLVSTCHSATLLLETSL